MHTTANEWARVVIHPLGLAGFVLFLVFRLLAGLKSRDERRWLFPSAILMAVTALVGGLGIAYLQVQRSVPDLVHHSELKHTATPGALGADYQIEELIVRNLVGNTSET
jgi:hypothetical protein